MIKVRVHNNTRLVHHYAKRYKHVAYNYQDLVSAGNIGLVKASQRYDASKGASFATYSSYWIKCEMLKLLKQEYSQRRIMQEAYTIEEDTNDITEADLVDTEHLWGLHKYVINNHYNKKQTLKSIAESIGLPYSKVRRIHNEALGKLKFHLKHNAPLS